MNSHSAEWVAVALSFPPMLVLVFAGGVWLKAILRRVR